MKYERIRPGVEARVHRGRLYVRVTDLTGWGTLKKGGHIDRVYMIPYKGTLLDAKMASKHKKGGETDIDRCIKYGKRTRKGYVI